MPQIGAQWPPDKNKDIEELKVAAVGGIYFKAPSESRGSRSTSPLFKGHDDESSLWRVRVLSAQLAAVAFTFYSEYEMTAKADVWKNVCLT